LRTPILLIAFALATPLASAQEQRDWRVHADVVYTAAGDALENATVATSGGKIRGVSKGGASGENALEVAAVTPGLIDLSVRVVRGNWSVEQSREISADIRVADALDAFSSRWTSVAQSGVTTALANPPDRNVIGGLGVVIKTAGATSVSGRTVKSDAVLRGSFGSEPSFGNRPASGTPTDFYRRRPTTRMGVEWEHRKAFYDAAAARRDDERAFPGSDQLISVLEGRRPFMVQTWATQDIRTAIYLKEEIEREGLGSPKLILDAAAEAWREPEMLVRSGASVVLPPHALNGRTTDGAFMTLELAATLEELGVTFALSAHGSGDDATNLGRQAGFAMRGGLSFESALAAVTSTPAKMLGIDDRVGTLEAGKDADLVLWSGKPFEATSAVIGVIVDGYLVLDPRAQSEQE
jgi:imidazolonepropionase-like amidohydrolase